MNWKLFLLTLLGLASFALAANNTNMTCSAGYYEVGRLHGSSYDTSNFNCAKGDLKLWGGDLDGNYTGVCCRKTITVSDVTCPTGFASAGGSVYIPPWTMNEFVNFCNVSYGGIRSNVYTKSVIVNNSNVTQAVCCIRVTTMVCPTNYIQTKKQYGGSYAQVSALNCSLKDVKVIGFDGLNNFALCCKPPSPTSNGTAVNNSNVSIVGGTKLRCPTNYKLDVSLSMLTSAANNYTCPTGVKKFQTDNRDGSSDVLCCKKNAIGVGGYSSKGATCSFRNAESCVSHSCFWYGNKKGFCAKNKYSCTLNN